MYKPSVFLEIGTAFPPHSYAGIPNETRLLFKVFSSLKEIDKEIDFASIITPHKPIGYFPTYKKDRAEKLYKQSLFFSDLAQDKISIQERLKFLLTFFKRKIKLEPIDTKLLWRVLWDLGFSKTLSPQDINLVKDSKFYLSNISWVLLQILTLLKLPPPFMNLNGDFLILPYPIGIKVPKSTKKIVRYHDAIPLTDTYTINDHRNHAKFHKRAVESNLRDAYFVCNSEPTRETLLDIYPSLEKRTYTIPCPVSDIYFLEKNEILLKKYTEKRLSSVSRKFLPKSVIQKINNREIILTVSTIEPRKNHVNILTAFDILKAKLKKESTAKPLLIFIGKLGWKYENIVKEFLPYLKKGELIHLEYVKPYELRIFYSHAYCVCFPSSMEGFGYAPVEAARCYVPSVVSDIPTHRWVMGDSALYANPYDPYDIADKLFLLFKKPSLKQELGLKAFKYTEKYTITSIAHLWMNLFERLFNNKD